jgi:hypothetical protein
MIQLTKTPHTTTFARNPAVFELQSSNPTNTFPRIGEGVELVIASQNVTTSSKLHFSFLESDGTTNSFDFTFVTPIANDMQYDTFATGSFLMYMMGLASALQHSHRIAPYFFVDVMFVNGSSTLLIISKGEVRGLVVTPTNFTISAQTVFPPKPVTTPVNYKAIVEVFGEKTFGGGDFKKMLTTPIVPSASGISKTHLEDVLETLCDLAAPHPPAFANSLPFLVPNLRNYYVRYTEEYGAPTVRQNWQYDTKRTVLHGGIAQNIFERGDWFTNQPTMESIVNVLPQWQVVHANMPVYVYLCNTFMSDLVVHAEIVIFYNDGSPASTLQIPSFDAIPAHRILAIPVLALLPNISNVAHFSIQFFNSQGIFNSQPRSHKAFFVIVDDFGDEKYLSFMNQFGCYETLRCTGITNTQGDFTSKEVTHLRADTTETVEIEKDWKRTFTYRTGRISKSSLASVEALMLSKYVYEVTPEGYMRVRITSKNISYDKQDDLNFIEIKAVPCTDFVNLSDDLFVKW